MNNDAFASASDLDDGSDTEEDVEEQVVASRFFVLYFFVMPAPPARALHELRLQISPRILPVTSVARHTRHGLPSFLCSFTGSGSGSAAMSTIGHNRATQKTGAAERRAITEIVWTFERMSTHQCP